MFRTKKCEVCKEVMVKTTPEEVTVCQNCIRQVMQQHKTSQIGLTTY